MKEKFIWTGCFSSLSLFSCIRLILIRNRWRFLLISSCSLLVQTNLGFVFILQQQLTLTEPDLARDNIVRSLKITWSGLCCRYPYHQWQLWCKAVVNFTERRGWMLRGKNMFLCWNWSYILVYHLFSNYTWIYLWHNVPPINSALRITSLFWTINSHWTSLQESRYDVYIMYRRCLHYHACTLVCLVCLYQDNFDPFTPKIKENSYLTMRGIRKRIWRREKGEKIQT